MFGPSLSIVYHFKKYVFNFVIYEVFLNKMAAMNSEILFLHSVTYHSTYYTAPRNHVIDISKK